MHFIGLAGLPGVITPTQIFHYLMTYRMLMCDNYFRTDRWGISINIFYNFFSSIFYGKKSVQNPWNSNTLEWTAPVEHIQLAGRASCGLSLAI
jgi:cytochrome c oxidase subunit 1